MVQSLSAEVDTYPQRFLAEHAALRVRGGVAVAVAEEVIFRNDCSDRTDTDVAREAVEALERAVDVPSEAVKAIVRDHIVLSGEVPWHYQREAAERAVRYVSGVFGVSTPSGSSRSSLPLVSKRRSPQRWSATTISRGKTSR